MQDADGADARDEGLEEAKDQLLLIAAENVISEFRRLRAYTTSEEFDSLRAAIKLLTKYSK